MAPGTCSSCSFQLSFWIHCYTPKNQTLIPVLHSSVGIVLLLYNLQLKMPSFHISKVLSSGGFYELTTCTDTSRVNNASFLIPFFFSVLFQFSQTRGSQGNSGILTWFYQVKDHRMSFTKGLIILNPISFLIAATRVNELVDSLFKCAKCNSFLKR